MMGLLVEALVLQAVFNGTEVRGGEHAELGSCHLKSGT